MKSKNVQKDLPVLCATCAWRETCQKKFSMDNTSPVKCPDYSPDVKLLKEMEEGREVGKEVD